MKHAMSSDESSLSKLNERSRSLENQLNSKVSNEYADLVRKTNETFREMAANTRGYYVRLATEALDKAEQAMKINDAVSAMTYKISADMYLAMARQF